MKWILTRSADDGRALADALGCELVPAIERVELPWPGWPAKLVIVTSRAVAQRLIKEARPNDLRIAAVAPATKALLENAGLRVDFSAEGGAVALARTITGPTDTFYPTSDAGIDQPEQAEAVALL